MTEYQTRKPLHVAWSVWSALFIREALQRTMSDRLSWFWILAQPVAQILIFIALRQVLNFLDRISGVGYIEWLTVGMLVYMLFSESLVRSLGAIDANSGLLSYRQVKVVDPIIARVALECFIKTIVFFALALGLYLLEKDIFPDKILEALLTWVGLMIFCLAFAMIFSAVTKLAPGLTVIVRISTMPMYFLSGVMVPLNLLEPTIQKALLINPILHFIELMRGFVFSEYQTLDGISVQYVAYWTICSLLLGLILHKRYEHRMKAQ